MLNAIMVEKTMATKGLMYVRDMINGKEVFAMVDIGATITSWMIRW